MRAWIHKHGKLLSRISLAAVVGAVAAPQIGLLVSIPFAFGGVPYPSVNPVQVALTISAALAVIGLAAGLAAWIVRAPGYQLGKTTVIVLGAIVILVGGIVLTGFVMSATHSPMRT